MSVHWRHPHATNIGQREWRLGQADLNWHACRCFGRNLSSSTPVSQHVCPWYCLYSIIFSARALVPFPCWHSFHILFKHTHTPRIAEQKRCRRKKATDALDNKDMLDQVESSLSTRDASLTSTLLGDDQAKRFCIQVSRRKTSLDYGNERIPVIDIRPEIPSFAFFLSLSLWMARSPIIRLLMSTVNTCLLSLRLSLISFQSSSAIRRDHAESLLLLLLFLRSRILRRSRQTLNYQRHENQQHMIRAANRCFSRLSHSLLADFDDEWRRYCIAFHR